MKNVEDVEENSFCSAYTEEKYSTECKNWKMEHGKVVSTNPIPFPNSMK